MRGNIVMKTLKFFGLLVLFVSSVEPNVFTVPTLVQKLFLDEVKLVNYLMGEASIKGDPEVAKYLETHKQVLDEFEGDQFVDADKVLDVLVSNPIHVFNVIRRCYISIPELIRHLRQLEGIQNEIVNFVENQFHEHLQLSEDDYDGASQSLARVQHTYRLPIEELVMGKIKNIQTKARMNHEDCIAMAESRLNKRTPLRPHFTEKEYALAIEWLDGAKWILNHQNVESEDDLGPERKVNQMLNDLWKEHDERYREHKFAKQTLLGYEFECFFIKPYRDANTFRPAKELRSLEYDILDGIPFYGYRDDYYNAKEYYAGCRGDKFTYDQDSGWANQLNLKCFLHRENPFLYIRPAKVEVLSREPLLYQYHDFVSEEEVNRLLPSIKAQLSRATTVDRTKKGERMLTYERTQSHMWWYDSSSKFLYDLSKRAGIYTGLITANEEYQDTSWSTAEPWQFGAYNPGGVYLPHQDAFEPHIVMDEYQDKYGKAVYVGNRIATFMIYFSDLSGGGTTFPNIGKTAFPIRGSAVFWYSLTNSAIRDTFTTHGGCPPMYGIKFVGNKWIREGAQMFRRPCNGSGYGALERILY